MLAQQRIEDDTVGSEDYQDLIARNAEKIANRRNLAAFWIFGLCNNFAYVVMLSAAHDILKEEEGPSSNSTNSSSFSTTTESPDLSYLQCNTVSTGAILLADILPTLLVKLTFPFFLEKIPYGVKISLISGFALSSFLIVALAHEVWLSILGVVCASIGAGLGEITFLSLTTFYNRNVVSMWSSGTGGAGVFGALVYAGFTSAGLSPRNSLLIMIVIPVLMMISYFAILTKSVQKEKKVDDSTLLLEEEKQKKVALSFKQKLKLIPSLFKYMIPLTLVYFGEYFINQGLHELLYFNGQWLSKSEQYRWYQVDYQIGVFISRSSVNLIHIKALWVLPILQFVNLALLTCQVFYRFIPNIWIVFVIVLWEGLLGGAAYVNTFFRMTNEVPADKREYCIGVACLGDSVGIALAGVAAIPSHNSICNLHLKM
ncbi:battenin-like [Physella acuta]|uniref:battenin-like n=1 Tax=Physella acuta TaxID=109671 RepID=UPI0027DCAB75|nr:battenin-like [Physella acuta]XP_059160549.1 battenin-like [Physella acuta]